MSVIISAIGLDPSSFLVLAGVENLCPHVCVLQCHLGLCPFCKAFALPWLCPYGKKIITSRCSDQKSVLTCGQCCEKLLERWRYRCERIFHMGHCNACQALVNASCFCVKKIEVVLCGEMVMVFFFMFGGKSELVWLNDKNALVVFSDLRAAIVMKRLDQGFVYYGVVWVPQNGGASVATPLGANTSGSTRLANDKGASGSLKSNP
ncbi:NF-X1-type zinc finger protein NFXL1 [Camellia lanceoleosa]|uniref:NF-X1-type zinc finger protein NFXL1 n=1 Tax=Camellia lanceoleosa TaxID=1840588 RepID=A0ACC0I5B0_9ERIC|nr:NF-X1-type zinc finger protein NFXL1 [Camellia lanceoleosa]